MYAYVTYFVVSLVLALLLVPAMRKVSFRLGAVDTGTGRRVHDGVIPRLGGVGIYLAVAVPMAFLLWRFPGEGDLRHELAFILAAATLVFLVGVWDDVKSATVSHKVIAEVLAALVIYGAGIRIDVLTNPFAAGGVIHLGWLSMPATVLWLVVITNAFNLTDGLDGLAAGAGILIAGTLIIVLGGENPAMVLMLLIIMGSLTGFLQYNFPPATIFMGDSGSLFLGFLFGSLAIVSFAKATAMATMMVPLLAFGHPLIDMGYTVLRRYYRGVPLGEADREHIHHKMLDRGMSKKGVVLTLYVVNVAIMAAVLVFIRRHSSLTVAALVFMALLVVVGVRLLGYVRFSSFARDYLREFRRNRRRRYFNFVIRRFEQALGESRSREDFEPHLESLLREYGFGSCEVFVGEGEGEAAVYAYRGKGGEEKLFTFDFPFVTGGGEPGRVVLRGETGEDALTCASELTRVLAAAWGVRR